MGLPENEHQYFCACRVFSVGDSVDIETSFRKEDHGAFYDLDEPVGHYVDTDDLFLTRKKAKLALLKHPVEIGATLEKYRESRVEFITSTYEDPLPADEFPDKKKDVDWFSK